MLIRCSGFVAGLTAAALLLPVSTSAAPIVYETEAAFLAAITSPGVDTFDDLSVVSPTPSPLNRTAGPYTYTASTTLSAFFAAGTAADPWLSTDTSTDMITFANFVGGVQAFGGFFFGTDLFGNFVPGVAIRVAGTDASGAAMEDVIGMTTSTFVGFVTTGTLTSVTVVSLQSGFWPTVDDAILGRAGPLTPVPQPDPAPGAVPEPASSFLLAVALLGAGVQRWRRS